MTDNWSGFADLLANLIEKYAEVLEHSASLFLCILYVKNSF